MKRSACLVFALILTASAWGVPASPSRNLRVSGVFSDHMVLQRDREIPIWGWGDPGIEVVVTLAEVEKRGTVDEEGNWLIQIPAMPAGGPHVLAIAGGGMFQFSDVMIGDVWICAGQSNMQMNLRPAPDGVYDADQVVAQANHPNIRLLEIPRKTSFERLHDLEGEPWKVCSPETLPTFSAVGFFFGRELHQHLGVPMGLINCTWGASPAEAWTSLEALESLPEFTEETRTIQTRIAESRLLAPQYEKDIAAWKELLETRDSGHSGGRPVWAETEFDASTWETMPVPDYWENHGYPKFDGVMWYRKEVEVPAEWEGKPLELGLCSINDMDRAYVNGIEVGRFEETAGFTAPRVYPVPGEIVRAGKNLVAVRVYDAGNVGGLYGAPQDLWLRSRGSDNSVAVSLVGDWQFKPGISLLDLPRKPVQPPYSEGNHRLPAVLFNAMVSPLTSFSIRGVIWYQGESNIGRAKQYFSLFPGLIQDWRSQWGQGDFPFLFVQLAASGLVGSEPVGGTTPLLREAQRSALALPNTAMVVTLDISDPPNGHPRNKLDVGKRLALAARKVAYGESLTAWGPMFEDMAIESGAIRVRFDSVGEGLKPKDGSEVRGFAIAGGDRQFVWGEAQIDGDSVVISSPEIPKPVSVRYGWSEHPPANLVNSEGLPASPFRTDDWED